MIDEKNKMDEIVENMANYICDHICQKPKEITDQEIRIHLGNFYDEAYLMVRINDGTPGQVTGGELTNVTGNLYLLHAQESEVVIERN